MKKTICVFMSVVLLLLSFPLSVSATEEKQIGYTRDEIVALASEVFPEYSDKIVEAYSEEPSAPTARGAKQLVRELSRETEDGEQISYAEYSDGEVLLSVARSYPYSSSHTITDFVIDGSISRHTITVVGTSSECSGEFTLSNVCIAIYGNGYDRFTNVGSGVATGKAYTYGNPLMLCRMIEKSTQNAIIKYLVYWPYGNGVMEYNTSWVIVQVGSNSFSVHHVTCSDGDDYL